MAHISDILANKGPAVISIAGDASVLRAAQLMNEYKIGGLVVTDGVHVEGIVTERDILRRVVAARRDPVLTAVCDIMTREVICCHPETSVDEARGVMMTRKIRHIPVVDHDELCGMVSIGDLNAYLATSQEMTIHFLHEYLYGQV